MTVVLLCLQLAAGAAQVTNATLETRVATAPIADEVAAIAARGRPAWIGYRVPMVRGPRHMCSSHELTTSPVLLEPPDAFTVLVRVEGGRVEQLRSVTPDCQLDAGGLPFVWLDGVRADDSASWLAALVRAGDSSAGSRRGEPRLVDAAIMAISLHTGDEALRAVIAFARSDPRTSVRSRALFWLGQRAGREAVATLSGAVEDDPEIEVKKRAVFALSQLPKDEGVPLLIQIARTHKNRDVRKQAMFWLGQSNDPRALAFFEEVLK